MSSKTPRATNLFVLLLVAGGIALAQEQPVLLPWQGDDAEARQVIRVSAPVERQDPVVELMPAGPADLPVRVVAAEDQSKPLAVYRERNGRVWVKLSGLVGPDSPRLLVVYRSGDESFRPSPTLEAKPQDTDDYATTTYGDAWDFEEGDQEGITSWGDRPHHYGKVEVREGRLIIPVTGDDPYFIWGVMFGDPGDRPTERISSSLYRYLRLRVRQSCERSKWAFYFTDTEGHYQSKDFEVVGSEWQEFEFDLARIFEGWWDGREMRALRIDTTSFSPGATAEIDWVMLTRPAPEVVPGPLMSREQALVRARVKDLRAELPKQAQAGQRTALRVVALDADGKGVGGVVLAVGLRERGGITGCFVSAPEAVPAVLEVAVGTTVGEREWVVGVSDDLGRPLAPVVEGPLTVVPAALDHYELTTPLRLVHVDKPRVTVTIRGRDRFGNEIPVDIARPQWKITGGAKVEAGPLKGAPATVTVQCSTTPLTRHRLELKDEAGHSGRLELVTMTLKKRAVSLAPNGYLVEPDGKLYLPLGGFYANWPAALPTEEGTINRALDLFPCGPTPYPHGYPWSAEVEKQVVDYLELCRKHGVTGLRLMLRNMDLVGRADPVQLKAVLHLFDLARPLGIKFNVVLFEDYTKPPYVSREVLEKVVLPQYSGEELVDLPPHRARFLVEKDVLEQAAARYLNRDAIACQKDYLDDLLPYLASREEVFCYEFENEMVFPPMSWVQEIGDYLRSIDPKTPILGNPGPHDWPEPWRWRDSGVDLFSYHPYNDGQATADHGAVCFMRSKWAAATGIPMFTGEGGLNQNRWQAGVSKVTPQQAARGIRDQIWLSMACGAKGAFMWTAGHELEMAEFGKVWPALRSLGLDLLKMQRRRPDVALVMPEDNSANARAYALGWRLLDLGVDFDTLPAEEAKGYKVRLEAATASPEALALKPELVLPGAGYQVAYLASEDLSQVMVYLRNVAGGIVNAGDGRPCYLRDPKTAEATLRVVGGASWGQVRAYDLDEGRETPVTTRDGGRTLVIAGDSTHDYVVGLSK
ncbi:MAG: hypothetical protein AB7W28_02475 [Armatimonadota bacterium]